MVRLEVCENDSALMLQQTLFLYIPEFQTSLVELHPVVVVGVVETALFEIVSLVLPCERLARVPVIAFTALFLHEFSVVYMSPTDNSIGLTWTSLRSLAS